MKDIKDKIAETESLIMVIKEMFQIPDHVKELQIDSLEKKINCFKEKV